MGILKYTDDARNFREFLGRSDLFKISSGSEWYILKKLRTYFKVLSGTHEKPFADSLSRELRYRYREEEFGLDIEGTIIVGIRSSKEGEEPQKITITPEKFMLDDMELDGAALCLELIEKKKLPLYMLNARSDFQKEIEKL